MEQHKQSTRIHEHSFKFKHLFLPTAADPKPKTKEEFTEALRRITRTSDDLRVMMSLGDDRDRLRRAPSFRRALSNDSDDDSSVRSQSAGRRAPVRPGNRGQKSTLYRKSQSLDHQLAEERGKIWVSTDAGSTSSIESAMTDEPRRTKYDFDRSLDRISTGSQTSDLDLAGDQKKKGLKTVFGKLGKSKSIEDSGTGGSIVGVGLKNTS
ncbi:hypothetical protein Avbf_13153 [Armadillidium vulgare]|nr:hypothetical protein Avbf_13153 [Armadillidium vulgare]